MPSEEKKAEDHHGEKWLDNGPGGTKNCLFVTHLDVTPGQKIEQIPILPQILELERDPPF